MSQQANSFTYAKKKMILVSHGKLAEGIVNFMQMVIGTVEDLEFLGLMPGQDPGELALEIEKQVTSGPDTQFLILADIRGGSVSNSVTRLTVYDNVRLINGMNLALVTPAIFSGESDEDGEII